MARGTSRGVHVPLSHAALHALAAGAVVQAGVSLHMPAFVLSGWIQ